MRDPYKFSEKTLLLQTPYSAGRTQVIVGDPLILPKTLHLVKSIYVISHNIFRRKKVRAFPSCKYWKEFSMAKSPSMQRMIDALKVEQYDDREEVLKVAKKEGFNSRQAVYAALAYTYQWYKMSAQDRPYMESKFKSAEISVSEWSASHLFIATIKLVFDFNEPKYYSRVSEYALVLQFIDRKLELEKYLDGAEYPGTVLEIIKDAGGVRKCALDQRSHLTGNETDLSKSEIEVYLQDECERKYQTKKPDTTVALASKAKVDSFVLILGRATQNGDVDIVDTMRIGVEEIYSHTKDHTSNDTTSLSDTLNLLSDALGYLEAFGPKAEPVVTVEKGGTAIYISLGKEDDASLVLTAKPKDQSILAAFQNRAHLSSKDRDWFQAKIQPRRLRRLYNIEPAPAPGGTEAIFKLGSNIKSDFTRSIHFNPMTPKTAGQVMTNTLTAADWAFDVGFGRDELDDLYDWTKGWLSLKRTTAADRMLPIDVDDQNITLRGTGGSVDMVLSANTGFPATETRTYKVFGREFCKVIEQLHLNDGVMGFYLHGAKKGLLEFRAEDGRLDYIIDLPTVMKDNVNYSPVHFDILQ